MNFNKHRKKGQGALEYLLIIGAAIIVSTTVILLIVTMGGSKRDAAQDQDQAITNLIDNALVPPVVIGVDCNVTGDTTIQLIESEKNGRYRIKVGNTIDNDVFFSNNGFISKSSNALGITSPGEVYSISVVSVKNNVISRPSMPAVACVGTN
jgi:uncharacterized protein (UPF0333 family)